MKKYFAISVLLCLFVIVACQKEKAPDPPIIEPGSYFPVYPDSWWKYLVNDAVVQFDTTSDDYIVHSFKIDGDPDRYSAPARVPFLNGEPIYGYSYVESVYFPTTIYDGIQELWPILSETVGFTFNRGWNDARLGHPEEIVCVKSKTFNGQDSILTLESYWYGWSIPGAISNKRYRQFYKNIGLVSEILVDTATSDTLSRKILIDYYVNHPF
jgi:hypothetical protein